MFFFCFPNYFHVYVASWFVGFLMILIKPTTLDVNFYVVEVGIIFNIFQGLLPLLGFWFCIVESLEPFDSFWVLVANLLESNGICAIIIDVKFLHLRWVEPFPSFIIFYTTPLNLITSLKVKTCIKFYINSSKDG